MSEARAEPPLPEAPIIAFEVTEADVYWGLRKDPSKCVVAKALERSFSDELIQVNAFDVVVYSHCNGDVRSDHYVTTPELKREIDRFDKDGDFAVGWYTIRRDELDS